MLEERVKKKSAPNKFYKHSVQNITFFNKDTVYIIRKIQTIKYVTYYWVTNTKNNKNVTKRFQQSKFFVIKSNFL